MKERVLFLHIPKTAGTSIKHYLSLHYAAQDCLLDPSHVAIHRTIKDVDFNSYSLAAAHFDFDYVSRYRNRPFVLTCLRNPIARAISAYNFQRSPVLRYQFEMLSKAVGQTEESAAVRQVLDELDRLRACVSLSEFLAREPEQARKILGNIQTHYLAGAEAASIHADEPRRLIEIAIANLRSCEGILLTERLSETLGQLALPISTDPFGAVTHDNATVRHVVDNAATRHEDVLKDAELFAALADLTSLDSELYAAAETILEERSRSPSPSPKGCFNSADNLPDATNFTFDQPVRGRGWHMRERGSEGYYCWSAGEATLFLSLATRGSHILRCRLLHVASSEAQDGLEATVNGVPVLVEVSHKTGSLWIEAPVPAHALENARGQVCIAFRVPGLVRPSDRDSANPDTRHLGIALSRVQLLPTETGDAYR